MPALPGGAALPSAELLTLLQTWERTVYAAAELGCPVRSKHRAWGSRRPLAAARILLVSVLCTNLP